MTVQATGMTTMPRPAAMPTAALSHRVAAVVRPRMEPLSLMMTPAPRKPTPVTIWAAIRDGSRPTLIFMAMSPWA